MTMQISIAMATYNGSKFLQQQLDSIAAQIYLPYELVVCDDGSTDDTISIIRRFALTASFPVYIVQNEKTLGYADNFLKAASYCSGEWIAFCDQDDVWHKNKLSKTKQVIDTKRSDDLVMVCHSADLVDGSLTPSGRRYPDFQKNQVVGRNAHFGFWSSPGFTISIRADLLSHKPAELRPQSYFYPYKKIPHDGWVCLLANALGEVAYIQESLALYRRHSAALTGSHDKQTVYDRIKVSSFLNMKQYQIEADAAEDSAAALRKISTLLVEGEEKHRLLAGASKFEEFSAVLRCRGRLYEARKFSSRLRELLSLLIKKGYWGSRFCSLGTLRFLKDTSVGVFGKR